MGYRFRSREKRHTAGMSHDNDVIAHRVPGRSIASDTAHFAEQPKLLIVYDGDCPFCSSYVKLVNLRESWTVTLLDVRSSKAAEILSLDELKRVEREMLVRMSTADFWGGDAMWVLARLKRGCRNVPSATKGSVIRFLYHAFYPVLRGGRAGILTILGKRTTIIS